MSGAFCAVTGQEVGLQVSSYKRKYDDRISFSQLANQLIHRGVQCFETGHFSTETGNTGDCTSSPAALYHQSSKGGARGLARVAHTSSVRYVKSLVFNYSRTVLLRKHIFFSILQNKLNSSVPQINPMLFLSTLLFKLGGQLTKIEMKQA